MTYLRVYHILFEGDLHILNAKQDQLCAPPSCHMSFRGTGLGLNNWRSELMHLLKRKFSTRGAPSKRTSMRDGKKDKLFIVVLNYGYQVYYLIQDGFLAHEHLHLSVRTAKTWFELLDRGTLQYRELVGAVQEKDEQKGKHVLHEIRKLDDQCRDRLQRTLSMFHEASATIEEMQMKLSQFCSFSAEIVTNCSLEDKKKVLHYWEEALRHAATFWNQCKPHEKQIEEIYENTKERFKELQDWNATSSMMAGIYPERDTHELVTLAYKLDGLYGKVSEMRKELDDERKIHDQARQARKSIYEVMKKMETLRRNVPLVTPRDSTQTSKRRR